MLSPRDIAECLYGNSMITEHVSLHDIATTYGNKPVEVSASPTPKEQPSIRMRFGNGSYVTLEPDGAITACYDRRDPLQMPSEHVYAPTKVEIKKEKLEPMKTVKTAAPTAKYTVPGIASVVHHPEKRSTTINWDDGTKTTVRVMEGENYDKYNGFCAAVMKKLFGTTTMAKRIRDRKDIEYIKAKQAEERKKLEAEAAERRAIIERREARKIAKQVQRDNRISDMVDDILAGKMV